MLNGYAIGSMRTLKKLLERLSDLDLSSFVDKESLHLTRSTWYTDVYTALLSLDGTKVKVAVKRWRVNMQSNLEFARVRIFN